MPTFCVSLDGFEPSTQGLKGPCSAAELQARTVLRAGYVREVTRYYNLNLESLQFKTQKL